jgi:heme exporter protein D
MLPHRCSARHRKLPFYYRPLDKVGTFIFLSAAVVVCQLYFATLHFTSWTNVDSVLGDISNRLETAQRQDKQNQSKPAFGACIMVKEDNDLLYEWLAYHYTVLPLGYLVVGSDIGNSQDPAIVLKRWTKAGIVDLSYWILQPEDFIHRHVNYDEKYGQNATTMDKAQLSLVELKSHHHHALIHRQKGFMTACTELLKKQGVGWTIYIDTDEFVALNPLTSEDEELEVGGKGHFSISNTSYEIRKQFLDSANNKTILDIVLELQRNRDMTECYTMPRLLVGALENGTCPEKDGVQAVQQLARAQLNDRFEHMSTLRFFQHAKKGDFTRSKYGKVMMDLSKIPDETIKLQQPRNIHRPYAAHCGAAGGAHFPNSFLFLRHYIGSWERYASRSDDHRRGRSEWLERAFVDEGSSACAAAVHWYPRFRRVGEGRANFLLGVSTTD